MSNSFERPPQPSDDNINESSEESESANLESQPTAKQQLFVAACNERLDELVELGMLPSQFAEERKRSAALIEEGLSDDPEEQGREFAEIGTESIGQFRTYIENSEQHIESRVQPYLEIATTLADKLEREGKEPEKVAAIKDGIRKIQEGLDEFRTTADKVKNLEIPISALNTQIVELESSLADDNNLE
jgi:hypothetical protein